MLPFIEVQSQTKIGGDKNLEYICYYTVGFSVLSHDVAIYILRNNISEIIPMTNGNGKSN